MGAMIRRADFDLQVNPDSHFKHISTKLLIKIDGFQSLKTILSRNHSLFHCEVCWWVHFCNRHFHSFRFFQKLSYVSKTLYAPFHFCGWGASKWMDQIKLKLSQRKFLGLFWNWIKSSFIYQWILSAEGYVNIYFCSFFKVRRKPLKSMT